MFSFFSKLRTEVTASISSLHDRVVSLETKVQALFNHAQTQIATKAVETVAQEVEKAPEAVVTKVEEVAQTLESKV